MSISWLTIIPFGLPGGTVVLVAASLSASNALKTSGAEDAHSRKFRLHMEDRL